MDTVLDNIDVEHFHHCRKIWTVLRYDHLDLVSPSPAHPLLISIFIKLSSIIPFK